MTNSDEPSDYLDRLAEYFRWYAAETFAGYEPHYERVCRHIADTPEVVQIIGAHPEDAHQPNVILAAVRYLLADDPNHPLAAVYAGESHADPGPLFCDLVLARRAEIDELLGWRRTQTNEIRRSGALALGLAEIHRRTKMPLAWIDLGCSAGLNLQLDRLTINYDFPDRTEVTGSEHQALSISCDVLGGAPAIDPSLPPIAWRVGVDRAPIFPSNEADARWLRACIFPSLAERAERLEAALALAQANPVELRTADAAQGIAAAIADAPDDTALVVTTSWVWFYLPLDTRAAVLNAMRNAGRPVHWFSLEAAGVVEGVVLGETSPVDRAADGSALVLWTCGVSSDERYEFAGWAHHHGSWIDWRLPSTAELTT